MGDEDIDRDNASYSSVVESRSGAVVDESEPVKPALGAGGESELQSVVFSQPVDHDGTQVYVKGWIDGSSDRPPVIFIHDLGETSTSYREAVKCLAERGYSCFVYDQRGHGRSGRRLGHIGSFDEFVSDLLQVSNWVRYKSNRRLPYFVAHGLGAVSAIYFLAKHYGLCQGALLLSPGLEDKTTKTPKSLVHVMAELLPRARLPARWIPGVMKPIRNNLAGVSAKMVDEILHALQSLPEVFPNVRVPIHVVYPVQHSRYDYARVFEMIGRHPQKALFETSAVSFGDDAILDPAMTEAVVDLIESWLLSQTIGQGKDKRIDKVADSPQGVET